MPDDRELGDTRPRAGCWPTRSPAWPPSTSWCCRARARALDSDDILVSRSRSASCSGSPSGGSAWWSSLAIVANLLPLPNPNFQNYSAINAPPSIHHLLGTDDLGRDLLSRLIFGARVSLVVGFGSVAIGMLIGGTLGLISGYKGGRLDVSLNAGAFVLLAFPAIVAVIAIVAFWGQSLLKITIIIGVATIPLLYRVVRASSLSFANRDFVIAARTLGASSAADRLPRDPPQRGAGRRHLRADHRGRSHRDRGVAGLPGAVGAPPHRVVGEHDLRGRLQRQPQHQPLHHDVAGAVHVPAAAVHQPHRRPAAPAVRHPRGPAVSRSLTRRRAASPSSSPTSACPAEPLLVVDDLHTAFRTGRGTVRAVDGVSLIGEPRADPRASWASPGRARPCWPVRSWACSPPRDVITSGTVHFAGHELTAMSPVQLRQVWGAELSMIFQDPMTALNPVKRIGRQITESLRLHLGMDRSEADAHGHRAAPLGGHPLPRGADPLVSRSSCRGACASG